MKPKATISFIVGAVFSGVGLYLAFRNVPMKSLVAYAAQANYWWTLPAAVSLILAYLVRSYRWQWLLVPTGRPRLSSAYHSLVISMMVNCLLPGRIGELARPIVLKKLEGLSIASSLATLGVERLLDLATLLILLLPTLMLSVPDTNTVITFGAHQLNRTLLSDLGFFALLSASLLLLMVFAIGNDKLRSLFISAVQRLLSFSDRIGQKRLSCALQQISFQLQHVIEKAAVGVKAIYHPQGFLTAMLTSLIFWGFSALSFYFLSLGSPGIDLSFIEICVVMVVICFFIALPSVPGFWGLWEAAGVFALSFLGIANDAAAGFSLFSHAFNVIPIIVAGWLSCLSLGFRWQTLTKGETSQAA